MSLSSPGFKLVQAREDIAELRVGGRFRATNCVTRGSAVGPTVASRKIRGHRERHLGEPPNDSGWLAVLTLQGTRLFLDHLHPYEGRKPSIGCANLEGYRLSSPSGSPLVTRYVRYRTDRFATERENCTLVQQTFGMSS